MGREVILVSFRRRCRRHEKTRGQRKAERYTQLKLDCGRRRPEQTDVMAYEKSFGEFGKKVAQVLLTR